MEEMEDTLLALVMALKVRITCAHSLHRYHLAIHVARHLQKCTSPLNRCLFYHSCPDRPPTHHSTRQTTRSATFFSLLARPLARIGNGRCCSDPSAPERSVSSSSSG
jgi:hypothetical protein